MARKLFDDGNDSDNEELSKIEVDKAFARRYEHNKQRESLQRYEELKKKGLISQPEVPSSSKGEDEEGEESDEFSSDRESVWSDEEFDDLLRPCKEKEKEFFETLIRLRNKDPSLRDENVTLFKMYDPLKKKGPEFVDNDNNNDDGKGKKKKMKTYDEEQEEIRKAFLEAAEDKEDEDELLRVKNKVGVDVDASDGEIKNLKPWLEEGKEVVDDELDKLSEEERFDEEVDEYEFRFQENAGDRIMGHSREVEGSVRKKVNARKEQRKHKEERMEIAKLEREEELRHLKNLKKKEIDDRVKKIMESAGIGEEEVVSLSAKELENEFDPEEYDRMMNKAFGDEYYEAEDVDSGFGSDRDGDEDDGEIEKPDFDKEDELLGLPKGWDGCGDGNGFLATRERILKMKDDGDHDDDDDDDDEEEEEEEEEVKQEEEKEEEVKQGGKRKRKRELALLEKAKEAMMEEYYKLDYEDVIGDLKTRFKYTKIKPNRYGLSAAEILKMDEQELNQYVSLKKLAPYSDKEWKVPNSKRQQMKMRIKELKKKEVNYHKIGKKQKRVSNDANASTSSGDAREDNKPQLEDSNADMSNLSRKARRKRHQAELKLSHSRLMAYGLASKPKKKQNTELEPLILASVAGKR
ncbi:hypothetical protein FNV43_RR02911 [Rhamnella rubrinervis]|uniref:Kri1-like C-terminal domain-containing protein n=1 Tax=Rhamnella rubrinervis TaxID=2594499 RepID=A0A8K0HI33_9ROSA|nr:hypothetical protein FNV43_RR02911 [Rhamnella rubrinervis]